MGFGTPELLVLAIVLTVLVLAGAGIVAFARSAARRAADRPAPVPPAIALPADFQSHLRALSVQGQKIQAIKQLREATGLSLLHAKNAVDAIAAGHALPTPGPDPAAPRSDLAYRARVLAGDGREDEAVRVVAAETGMSGPEATAFVRALRP